MSPPSIMEVAKVALTRNSPLLMNLSAPFICQHFIEPLMQVMPYVDVIFGNETVSITKRKILEHILEVSEVSF